MKKIAFLSHLGLNLYLFRLPWMKKLKESGFDVYAVIPEDEYAHKIKEDGIKVVFYGNKRKSLNPFRELFTILELRKVFKKYNFDIIHTFTLKPNIYGTFAGKLSGTPCIINHVTGLGYIHIENNFKAKSLKLLEFMLYKITFSFAKKVVFQNFDDLAALNCLIKEDKATVIKGSGVDTDYFSEKNVKQEDISLLRQELGLADGGITVTFIARLIWHKGIREFIDSANDLSKKYKHCNFIVVGWIDRGNPVAIDNEYILKSRENPQIHFIGERGDIKNILALTDIFVLPSFREGMPRTILEAMSMSKPVVTCNVPGCRQAVRDGENGFLVPPRDSKILSARLEQLINSRGLREMMGKCGRNMVVEQFSNHIIINQNLKLYENI